MPKLEAIKGKVSEFKLSEVVDGSDEDFELAIRVVPAIAKLPAKLKSIGFALLSLDEKGNEFRLNRYAEDYHEKQPAIQKQLRDLQVRFDKLAVADRKKIFAAIAPKISDSLEDAWQLLKSMPYQSGMNRKAFRAPKNPELTLPSRIRWIHAFAEAVAEYQPSEITLPWLAAWSQHAFDSQADCSAPVLIAAMNKKDRAGDEVYDILIQTVTREHPIGIMGAHVIQSLLGSNRQAGWELIGKTLLAAQRQEGLRQSILENADMAHPAAFEGLLRTILENDLIRFSSVARSINGWFELLWDSISTKVLTEYVESTLQFLGSEAERNRALRGDDAEAIYRALWTHAYFDAPVAIAHTEKLIRHKKEEIRFVAAWFLNRLGLAPADRLRASVIEDVNLQIALLGSVKNGGFSDFDDLDNGDEEFEVEAAEPDKNRFENLELLYQRLPEKATKLPAIVWPWTERKIERSMLAGLMHESLGDRPPTRLLPYIKGMDSWEQSQVIQLLAAQKKWDTLTRSTLLELVGNSSQDIRQSAFQALEKQSLQGDEYPMVESFLTRQAADLRSGIFALIAKSKDKIALESVDRLLAKGDRNQRLAGLELLRQLAEGNRSREACKKRAETYRAEQKKPTKEEEIQLAAIADSDREVVRLDSAFGFLNPSRRSKVAVPKKRKLNLITNAAIACIKSLDDLIHANRTVPETLTRSSRKEEKLFGELLSYEFPDINPKKPLEPQRKRFPLADVWDQWKKNRPAALKDKDGLELVRAYFAAELFGDYFFDDIKKYMKKPDQREIALAILGQTEPPKCHDLSHVEEILEYLLYIEIPAGTTDFLLDCAENTFAHVPEAAMKELMDRKPKKQSRRMYWDDDENDWRKEELFSAWPDLLSTFLYRTEQKLSDTQFRRQYELERFHDEPCAGAPRRRPRLRLVADAYRAKIATFDDIIDCLLGPDVDERTHFEDIAELTRHPRTKQCQEIFDNVDGLQETIDKIREFLLTTELNRGEAPTPSTHAALCIGSIHGIGNCLRIMAALNNGKFKVDRSWRGNTFESRSATLTQLLQRTYPLEKETSADFARAAKQAISDGYCNETRLIELAFLAPQWSKFIGDFLNWAGFSEGLYWFLTHMNTWYSEARDAAASAEGLADDNDAEDDDFGDDNDDDDENNSNTALKPKKLSAWERLILERTPLTEEELVEGAVDVDWFHRTWNTLGDNRWKQMAECAKFAANSAQANKAQFLAEVLLGNKPRKELVEGINKKKLKEHVRLLGLLPLATGSKRDSDLMERYEVLQGYKKYARGLSSLARPSALRAVEIGLSNLARMAGFPDPLRLEWALEAESVKDLAKGPIEITKEGITVSLRLDEHAKPELTITRGDKSLKSIPAPIKKKHAAIADLAERATELRKKASRMKLSLETAMCRGDEISASELVQLFHHAILAPQLAKIVLIGDGIAGYPDKGGKALRDYRGKFEPIKKEERLRIAHSCDLFARGDWDQWQHDCFRAELIQPFKQIFRELYVITKQEKKDQTKSNRFVGQQVSPRQAMALWNARGWHTQEDVVKIFHDVALIAQVHFQYDYGTASEIEGLTVDAIEFRKRDEVRPMKLIDVPPKIFSEVMRDIDLVVSVAHRGEVDPEASASTVEMRAALIRETCQLLGLKNVTVKENHAVIKGHYAQYSLHLGSGGIHRLPGGALAILPVHAQHRGRIFLPFADDDPKTAEIVSKVLLLARDEEIQDPMILDQLGADPNKRPEWIVQLMAAADAISKPSKKKGSKETCGGDTQAIQSEAIPGNKRRFEFQEGTSSKFWEVELLDKEVKTTWGRIGSGGQSKTKSFADAGKARSEYNKLVQEKTGKGYKETH
jgi:predicted DNA-binding WGR domain protein